MDDFRTRLNNLKNNLEGDLKYDKISTTIYSTDASVYKEEPIAVVWPKGSSDIKKLISFARKERINITMRAGGTSLAGQVVSSGIIADVSKYMNKICFVNQAEMWATVEPGVVLDELNIKLKGHGLFFAPETSTSNRCNIGGMIGNNACGSRSLIYGSARDHIIELTTILSDGTEAVFGPVGSEEFAAKCTLDSREGDIYRNIKSILEDAANRRKITEEFPDARIPRRNTGYALDLLMDSVVFNPESEKKFNFCKLIAGSEGTLAVITKAKLNLIKLPPPVRALVCVHLKLRNDAFMANLIALKHWPSAVEMMDYKVLELTEDNISQRKNRFFLEGKPGAILIIEFIRNSLQEINESAAGMINEMKEAGYGYSFPVVTGKDISKVWELRKAGLGVLANMQGDPKPVTLMEDAAINVEQMPSYIEDVENMLAGYGKTAVYHAHIGTGELHIRPVLNLKDPADVDLFRKIGLDAARLVKKYKGSLSGEHGDGRLRGEFIPLMLGEHIYDLLKQVKETWDPDYLLNPGKIINTPPMNSHLRYDPTKSVREIKTYYDFSTSSGILRAAEKCNGSGDCRKSALIGGIMCPTYMATGDEDKTTRARANIVREFLNREGDPWDHIEIYKILDLCIGCKGCKSECPSNVDMAKIKSEFLQHWHDKHGIPLRTRLIAYISDINKIGALAPWVYNFFISNKITSVIIKKAVGFATERSIPLLQKTTLRKWINKNLAVINPQNPQGTVCLFIDEFTNYNDTATGISAIQLLTSLNYRVITAGHSLSGRPLLSKGLLRSARKVIRKNIESLSLLIGEDLPLIGIEPSAILGFRDEFPELADDDQTLASGKIAANAFMIDEFIAREFRSGKIKSELFTEDHKDIIVHAHCQQKAIATALSTIEMLSIPVNYSVKEIPSGCCGMAGSFGYEKEHYDLSNRIGELVLFPEIRNAEDKVVIAAPGTSCRHHIKDGTGRIALHPALILYNALKKTN